jgi:ABC-type nitrate/sulfonate/bicarbonate transport system permease component
MKPHAYSRHAARRVLAQFAGLTLLFGGWQVAGSMHTLGGSLPPATTVGHTIVSAADRELLARAVLTTASEALGGLVVCAALATLAVTTSHLLRWLSAGLNDLATLINAVPLVTFGPILVAFVARQHVPLAMAVAASYFPLYASMHSSLHRARASDRDLFTALGAGRARTFLMLDVPASVPTLVGAMPLVLTSALLGAVVGEWFGAREGLGVIILSTLQNSQDDLLWAATTVTAALSLSVYGIFTLLSSRARRLFDA